jgi:hypothetical protein
LLGAVVQVALDAAAGGISGGHDPCREAVRAARASALAMAVAASSVNPASRASVPAGSGSARDPTIMTPHNRPSTLTGTPTTARTPNSRAASARGPEALA